MKTAIVYSIPVLLALTSCGNPDTIKSNDYQMTSANDTLIPHVGYSEVNGIRMYYEIYGQGKPLVLIHGAGSTIQTTFGRIIPLLVQHRQLICLELQAHGRTGDRSSGLSFEQDADDVAALLKNLGIARADIFGFSNGGNTALQIGIRHPEMCRGIIAASPLLKRSGTAPQFWEFMKTGTFEQMPQQYKDAFLQINPDSARLLNMFQRCADRMNGFKDFPDEQLKSIRSPVLLVNGTEDVASPEHIVAMSRLIPNCTPAILPGGHGEYIGEITSLKPGYKTTDFTVPILVNFLNGKEK